MSPAFVWRQFGHLLAKAAPQLAHRVFQRQEPFTWPADKLPEGSWIPSGTALTKYPHYTESFSSGDHLLHHITPYKELIT
jgi:hypothetical protein